MSATHESSDLTGRSSRKPDPTPPRQYRPSYAEVGVVAQRDRLIEVRAPDPDGDPHGGWPRIWLTPMAASKLRDWLEKAVAVADGDEDPEGYG